MASVKWLRSITAITEPFQGVQQTLLYRYRRSADDPGTPVTRKRPRALMAPPGMPEFLTRTRHVRAGRTLGRGPRVVGSRPGQPRRVQRRRRPHVGRRPPAGAHGRHGWSAWSYAWDAGAPGEYELCVRATDSAGDVQPLDSAATWNQGGYAVNAVQRVAVRVT